MFRKSWVLALGLALAPAVSIAQINIKTGEVNSPNIFDNCTTVTNQVTNCRFDTMDFTGWIQGGDLSFSSVQPGCGHSGNFCAFMGPVSYNGTLTQCVATPAATCTLSFWMMNSGQPSHLGVEWKANTVESIYFVPNVPYAQYSVSGLSGGAGGTACLTFEFYNVPDFIRLTDVVVQCP